METGFEHKTEAHLKTISTVSSQNSSEQNNCIRTEDERFKTISFFAALCMFLSAIEYAVPKPLPFLRLGLANLPILLSLTVMNKKDTVFLILLKILSQGLISGTLFSYVFVFSAAGSFSSGLMMLLIYNLFKNSDRISYIGISMAGALANNAAQILVARLIIFGENTRYIAPILLIAGGITGFLLGMFTNQFTKQSNWYESLVSVNDTKPSTATGTKSSNAAKNSIT